MKKANKRFWAIPLFIAMLLLIPGAVAAFDYGYIVSDFDFFNYKSLSLKSIQTFLSSQAGSLKSKTFITDTGQTKTAAEIIYDISQKAQISPKVIITTLQKEQSLITTTPSSESVYNKAMGYGCPDSGGCSSRWASFYKQINAASLQFVWDAQNPSTYKPGQTYTIDGQSVTMKNGPTTALYRYTPHLHGNKLFSEIWNRWFITKFPDGTLIRADGESGVWLIANGKRHGFYSRIAFLSRGYDFRNVIVRPKAEVLAYDIGGGIDFANYSVVRDETETTYFIDGLNKRPIPSTQVFNELGFIEEEVIPVKSSQLTVFTTTSVMKSPKQTSYPKGILVQNNSTGAIGFVQEGVLYMLHSKEVLRNQFPNQSWIRISDAEFKSFKRGAAIKLRDGTLVRSPRTRGGIYLISNGKKLPIPSREIFDAYGFKMENVVKTNDTTLDLHNSGKPLDYPS